MDDDRTAELERQLIVRTLRLDDLAGIQALQKRAYPDFLPWSRANLANHLAVFPEGQIGVELDGKLVASSTSCIVDSDEFDEQHTYEDVCPNGTLDRHDPEGDTLYGLDIVVSPEARGMRLARRIYEARKALIEKLNLRRLVLAGRMPGYGEHAAEMSPRQYVRKVVAKELADPVIATQLANGFTIRTVLDTYLPGDAESKGNAVLMEWHNPGYVPESATRRARTARVATVQYQMRSVKSFEEFAKQCEFFVEAAGDYQSDFLLFPELLTNQLFGLLPPDRPGMMARSLDAFTERYVALFVDLALRYNVNIIGGSHLLVEDDRLFNVAFLFRRDGSIDRQYKLHITPAESRWWGVAPGNEVRVFDTDRGRIAICICYDVEFPEVARIAKSKGAELLFIPYNTDIRPAHVRVRTCAHARAIENHLYCILSGACGNLPLVEGADIHWSRSCILTPSDIPFARDGVATEATPNVEAMLVHELDLELLRRTQRTGAVRTWRDRRKDLYAIRYGDDEV